MKGPATSFAGAIRTIVSADAVMGVDNVLAMRHWHLLQLLLAGAAGASGIFILRVFAAGLIRILRPAGRRAIDKVPISL